MKFKKNKARVENTHTHFSPGEPSCRVLTCDEVSVEKIDTAVLSQRPPGSTTVTLTTTVALIDENKTRRRLPDVSSSPSAKTQRDRVH